MSVWLANIWRFSGGKIVEWWLNIDTPGLRQQLRAVPPLGQSGERPVMGD
jgi:hypothetical protein